MEVIVAFYKAFEGNFVDKSIGTWTYLTVLKNKEIETSYSHCELILDRKFKGSGKALSFSSSYRDGGVRKKVIDYDPNKWDFLVFNIELTFNQLLVKCKQYIGFEYDLLGIFLNEFLPFGIHNLIKWYCSEILNRVIFYCLINKCQISPNKLFIKILKGNGYRLCK